MPEGTGAGSNPNPPRSPSVLLAEDDPELRELMAAALEKDGAEVLTFSDGIGLANWLDRTVLAGDPLPDLVVTDLAMPGMTGMRVLGAMRRNGWRIPTLIVSAYADQDVHDAAKVLGTVTVLHKPVELSVLRAAARRALAV